MDSNAITHSTLDEGYDFHITDKWGETHLFRISTFMVPSGLLSEALEVIEESEEKEPRQYTVLSDFDADIEHAELMLKGKIKKGINVKYLEFEDDRYSIHSDNMSGRFLGDYFEIDGLKFSSEDFMELIGVYAGYKFTIKFEDLTE
jgi:hypothetical protein